MSEDTLVSWVPIPTDFHENGMPRLSVSVTMLPADRTKEGDLESLPDGLKKWPDTIRHLQITVEFMDAAGNVVLQVGASVVDVEKLDTELWRDFFSDLENVKPLTHQSDAAKQRARVSKSLPPIRSYPSAKISSALKQVTAAAQGHALKERAPHLFSLADILIDAQEPPGLSPIDQQISALYWEAPADLRHRVRNSVLEAAAGDLADVADRYGQELSQRRKAYHALVTSNQKELKTLADEDDDALRQLVQRNLHRMSRYPFDRLVPSIQSMIGPLSKYPDLTLSPFNRANDGKLDAQDFLQAALFHGRVPGQKGQALPKPRLFATQTAEDESTKQRGPWTQRVAAIRNFPNLAKRVGLTLDLNLGGDKVTAEQIIAAYGQAPDAKGDFKVYGLVRIRADRPLRGIDFVNCTSRFCLESFHVKSGDQIRLFRLQDRRQSDGASVLSTKNTPPVVPAAKIASTEHWLRAGSLDLGHVLPSGQKKFRLDTLDLDGGVLKLISFARSYQKLYQNAARIVTKLPNANGVGARIVTKNERSIELLLSHTSVSAQLQAVMDVASDAKNAGPLDWFFKKEDIAAIYSALGGENTAVKRRMLRWTQSWTKQGLPDHLLIIAQRDGEYIRWSLEPERENAADKLEVPPAHRTVGLSLYSTDRAADVTQTLMVSAAQVARVRGGKLFGVLADGGADEPAPFYSAELLYGLAPQVRFEKQSKAGIVKSKWYSLCERDEKYDFSTFKDRFPKVQVPFRMPVTRATDRPPAQGSDQTTPDELYASERLFSWQGWSLTVPNDRFHWKDQRPDPAEQPVSPFLNYPLVRLDVSDHSLPPLRFSRPVYDETSTAPRPARYDVRVAAVDRTGYVRDLDRLRDEDKTELHHEVLRFEPIPHPSILLTEPYLDGNPAKSLGYMAVRDGKGKDERYIAPPRTGLSVCELHGVLDELEFEQFLGFSDVRLNDDGQFPVLLRGSDSPLESSTAQQKLRDRHDDLYRGTAPALDDPGTNYEPFYVGSGRNWKIKGQNGYFPDPMARRIKFVLTDVTTDMSPAQSSQTILRGRPAASSDPELIDVYPSGVEWPNAQGFRLVLLPIKSGHPELHWDRHRRRLTVALAPGSRVQLALSSAPDVEVDSPFGPLVMANYLENSTRPKLRAHLKQMLAKRTTADSLFQLFADQRDGLDKIISPPLVVDLVHAVRRPLPGLAFGGDSPKPNDREEGALAVSFKPISVVLNEPTTGDMELHASWTDQVDNIEQPKPGERKDQVLVQKRAAETPLETNPLSKVEWKEVRHEFKDTKYHKVTYWLRGITRFMEHYSHELGDTADHSIKSPPVERIIKSSQAPQVVDYLYSVPIFGWSQSRTGGGAAATAFTSRRETGLRIWMDRGWNSQGNGELLAVLLPLLGGRAAVDPGQLFQLQDLVTRWGADPTEPTAGIDDMSVGPEHFRGGRVATVQTQEIGANGPFKVRLVAFAPEYDERRRLWYCDLPMTGARSYFGFIKLALARYQPNSIAGKEISRVFRADFMQMVPERWINVTRNLMGRTITLEVHGSKPGDGGPADQALTGNFSIVVERQHGVADKDSGWTPVEEGDYQIAPVPGNSSKESLIAAFKLKFAQSFRRRRRIVVVEDEKRPYRSKFNALAEPQPQRSRLIYTDVIEV